MESPKKFKEVQYMSGFANNPFDSNNNNSYDGCGKNSYDRKFCNFPFTSELETFALAGPNAGECALIHELFVLNVTRNLTQSGTPEIIYQSNRFVRCGTTESIHPFGKIIVRNVSNAPVSITVEGDGPAINRLVPANSEVAINSSSIASVYLPPQNVNARLLVLFDVYYPANPNV